MRCALTRTLIALLCLLPSARAMVSPEVRARQAIEIYRDPFGVPSIHAERLEDALYAFGYATAQDDAERMALNYKQARGRLAEVEGRSQLLADGFIRSLGMEDLAETRAAHLPAHQRSLIQAYCDGANFAVAEQKGRIPGWIPHFTPVDVLALAQFINSAFPLLDIARSLFPGFGSNQFAVSAARSADGHALISMDPHLTWDGPFAWYEFAIYTPDLRFRGVAIPGLPFGVMGHTDRVAWCMTNNDPSLFALYKVTTNPANVKQYSYHGTWRDFEDVPLELKYRDGDQLKTSRQVARRTAWGPLAPFTSIAVDLTTLASWEMLDEALTMARARDCAALRRALQPRGISMWNIVYADTGGGIGYQYNARVPKRDPSFDWRRAVPGSDPRTRLQDLWALAALPHAENPRSGVLVNCNSAPWLTTLGGEIRPNAWPRYVTSHGHTTRYDRLAVIVPAAAPTTPDSAKACATDTLVPAALQSIKALSSAAARPDARMTSSATLALGILAAWNGRADADSRGCALYHYWLKADRQMMDLARRAANAAAWSPQECAEALAALDRAAAALTRDHGRLDIPWGQVHYSVRGTRRAPLSGFQLADMVAVVPNTGPEKNGDVVCNVGSSFRMIVDLDPNGVRSWSILPYGEAQNPDSPHYADQQALFGLGQYKDTFYGLQRIKAGAASVTHLKR